jgi:hypothetical protein
MNSNILTKKFFTLFSRNNQEIKIEVFFENGTIWLSQNLMSKLFEVEIPTINEHLKNIYKTNELTKNSTIRKFLIVQKEGLREIKRQVNFYNLDSIISVGYRVNSKKATDFRIWATRHLKEFILKGFVIDDNRLKQGTDLDKNYFDELIEKVREIRTSERNFYQKITDIYSTSIDYDKNSQETKNFFSTTQNKMHFGIHGKTAQELIHNRISSKKENLGLTTINSKEIKRSDIFIAKNYLNKNELEELNLIVDQYLSFAELQAKNNKEMTQEKWILKLDDFLKLNEKEILKNNGKISKTLVEKKANKEYDIFNKKRLTNYESDFDKLTKKYL